MNRGCIFVGALFIVTLPGFVAAVGDEANKQCLDTWKYGPREPRHRCQDKTNGKVTASGYCAGPHDCVIPEDQVQDTKPKLEANMSSSPSAGNAAPLPNNSRAMLPWNDPRVMPTPSEIEEHNNRRNAPSFAPENPVAWEQFKQVPEVPKGATHITPPYEVPLPFETANNNAEQRTAPNTGFSYAGESAEDRAFKPSKYQLAKQAAVRVAQSAGSAALGLAAAFTYIGGILFSNPAH